MTYYVANGQDPDHVVELPEHFPSLEDYIAQIFAEIEAWFTQSTMRSDEKYIFATYFANRITEINNLYLTVEIIDVLNRSTFELELKIKEALRCV